MIRNVRMNFGQCSEMFCQKSSEIFGKCSEIFGEMLKYPWYCCLYNKQNITCPLVDTYFIFSCSTRYLITRSLRSLVRFGVEQWNIKSVSTRGHVISAIYMLYVFWWSDVVLVTRKSRFLTAVVEVSILITTLITTYNYLLRMKSTSILAKSKTTTKTQKQKINK